MLALMIGKRSVLYELPNIDIKQINDVTHIHISSCSEIRKIDQMTKVQGRFNFFSHTDYQARVYLI